MPSLWHSSKRQSPKSTQNRDLDQAKRNAKPSITMMHSAVNTPTVYELDPQLLDLLEHGLAVRCCFLGEQGYTAATYLAFSVFHQGGGTTLPKKPGTPG